MRSAPALPYGVLRLSMPNRPWRPVLYPNSCRPQTRARNLQISPLIYPLRRSRLTRLIWLSPRFKKDWVVDINCLISSGLWYVNDPHRADEKIILSRYLLDETKMLKCWIFTGLATRMILPLGLNVRSAEFSLKSVMLPPAVDALEREERIATVWMAFYHDTVSDINPVNDQKADLQIGSAASGWGTSLSVDELVSISSLDPGLELISDNPSTCLCEGL